MIIADPPYGVNYELSNKFVLNPITRQARAHKSWGKIRNDGSRKTAVDALPHFFDNLTCDGVAYILCGSKLLVDIANWLDERQIYRSTFLVWDKAREVITWERYHPEHENVVYCGPGAYPTGKRSRWFGPRNETTIWRIIPPNGDDRVHPTQKPVELYERAIANSSRRGEIIVDPLQGREPALSQPRKLPAARFASNLTQSFVT